MGRQKKLSISSINVTAQPHSNAIYENMLLQLCRKKTAVVYRSQGYRFTGTAMKIYSNTKGNDIVSGRVFRYTDIDPNSDWINTDTLKKYDKENISVPDNARPNSVFFEYIFFLKEHKMFIETYKYSNKGAKTLNPNIIKRVLDLNFEAKSFKNQFGDIATTVIPTSDSVESIFEMYDMRELLINLTPPNPDDLQELEDKLKKRLSRQNASRQTIIMKAKDGNSLTPDKETKDTARVASKNGSVVSKGKNTDGKSVTVNTENYPLEQTEFYDPEKIHPFDVMIRMAEKIMKRLT